MNKLNKMPAALVVAWYYLVKISEGMLHPLKELPEPDFNNAYDSSML